MSTTTANVLSPHNSPRKARPTALKLASSTEIPWSSSPPTTRTHAPSTIASTLSITSAAPNALSRQLSPALAPPPPVHPTTSAPPTINKLLLSPRSRRRLAIFGTLDPSPASKAVAHPVGLRAVGTSVNSVASGSGASTAPAAGQVSAGEGTAKQSKKRPWEPDANLDIQRDRKKATASTNTMAPIITDTSVTIRAKVVLSAEQQRVLGLVIQEARSLFFTGSAGTGKSVLLREIIAALRRKHAATPDAVAVTASTGIAACNIGGTTIHSFAGIGLGAGPVADLVKAIRKNRKALTRWLRTKVWIIDEVSMLDGDLFDKLSEIGSVLRQDASPFGGLQMVITGDFFQLPPVSKSGAKFAFEAKSWAKGIQRTVNLTQVFRQRDQTFIDILNEMRFGSMSDASASSFSKLTREVIYSDGIVPTELYPLRAEVESANQTRMKLLRTDAEIYTAFDGGSVQEPHREKLLSNTMAQRVIVLKIDAQVMLTKNVDETLVNGSMGKITAFLTTAEYKARKRGEEAEAKETDAAASSMGAAAAAKGKAKSSFQADKRFPVVLFNIPGGGKREVHVLEEEWKVELPNGEVQASRKQVPLILAWALSIHKSQGQTLERVKVDLDRIFEKGQAYVALSRATSMDTLQVKGFNSKKVMCHPKVLAWSKGLESLR